MVSEEWVPISGFEGYYEVSNHGKIRSLPNRPFRKNGRLRKPYPAPNGYLRLVLTAERVRKTVSVHRVVAEHFIPNPDKCKTVNHKDFDVTNNRVCNLEWMSVRDNIKHSCDAGRHYGKPVGQYDLSDSLIKVWSSAYQVQCELGYHATLISRCCLGKQATHKGFIWKFYKNDKI